MADHPSALGGYVRRPFAEQSALFRRKLGRLVPTTRWDDLDREAHDTAFMVAGATKADLLAELAAAVDRAVTEGTSLEAFRQDFAASVEAHDWHGWTGEETKGGRAWRTRTIYRTNAATSYAAGRRAQLDAGGFKFWVYRHGGSAEPRPEHLQLDGLILPADHPAWSWLYPPNGWGCSCYVVGARTLAGAKRLGGDQAVTLPAGWEERVAAGERPKGIDRGWDYAPGASVAPQVAAIAAKLGKWEHQIGKAFLTGLPPENREAVSRAYRRLPSVADDLRRLAQRTIEGREPARGPTGERMTLGMLGRRETAEIGQLTGVDVDGYDMTIDRARILHVDEFHGPSAERRHDQWPITAEDFALLPLVVDKPDEIVRGRDQAGQPTLLFRRRIAGQLVEALFVLRGKQRRSLELVTMWIKK